MRDVLKLKIDSSFFFGAQQKAAFIYLHNYYKNPLYNDTPSPETFWRMFPNFPYITIDDSVRAICDQIRSDVSANDILQLINEVAQAATIDPAKAMKMLSSGTSSIYSRHHVDQARTVVSLLDEVVQNYMRMESNPTGLRGWAFPWNALNKSTLGAQEGHLGVIYARPKRKKTWTALAGVSSFVDLNVPGIIFSQELPVIEMCERWVALKTGINYSRFLRGKLDPVQRANFFQDVAIFREHPGVVIDRIDSYGEEAVAEASFKCKEHGARWYLLDGAYKLGSDDWRQLAKVTEGLKNTNLKEGLFGLMTSQGKQMKGKNAVEGDGNDMAYGSMFQVDCDWGMHLSSDIEDLDNRRVTATVAFIRSGIGTRWRIKTRLCEDLSQTEELPFSESDVEDQVEADAANDELVDAISQDFSNPNGSAYAE